MKRPLSVVLLVFLAPSVNAASLGDRGMLLTCRNLAMGNPAFTDINAYNSRDFAGSPIGMLETESTSVEIDGAYRYLGMHLAGEPDSLSRTVNSVGIPKLRMGAPGTAFFTLWYTPDIIASTDSATGEEFKLPLHRFGLEIVGGVPSGIFRIGCRGEAFVGRQTRESDDNERIILGVQDLGLFLSSQVHKFLRIGFDGHATAFFDSLRDVEAERGNYAPQEDRYYSGQIPRIGGNIDFGAKGFPVLSNFYLDKGINRFIYVTKNRGAIRLPEGNERPITGDSLEWKWQTMVDLTTHGLTYRPAFMLAYWTTEHQLYDPDADNNNPLIYGDERVDEEWKTACFRFGLGGNVTYQNYGGGYLEFRYANMSLEYGDAFTNAQDKSDSYVDFGLGLEGHVHGVPQLHFPSSVELNVRLGYLFSQRNAWFDPFRADEFAPLNPVFGPTSQYYRYPYPSVYQPAIADSNFSWGPTQSVSRFSFGIGGSFRKMIGLDLFFAFPRLYIDEDKTDGFEFGLDLTYNLPQTVSAAATPPPAEGAK